MQYGYDMCSEIWLPVVDWRIACRLYQPMSQVDHMHMRIATWKLVSSSRAYNIGEVLVGEAIIVALSGIRTLLRPLEIPQKI
jgi:hypothetical protein